MIRSLFFFFFVCAFAFVLVQFIAFVQFIQATGVLFFGRGFFSFFFQFSFPNKIGFSFQFINSEICLYFFDIIVAPHRPARLQAIIFLQYSNTKLLCGCDCQSFTAHGDVCVPNVVPANREKKFTLITFYFELDIVRFVCFRLRFQSIRYSSIFIDCLKMVHPKMIIAKHQ